MLKKTTIIEYIDENKKHHKLSISSPVENQIEDAVIINIFDSNPIINTEGGELYGKGIN